MSKYDEWRLSASRTAVPVVVTVAGRPAMIPTRSTVWAVPDWCREVTVTSVSHMNPNFEPRSDCPTSRTHDE